MNILWPSSCINILYMFKVFKQVIFHEYYKSHRFLFEKGDCIHFRKKLYSVRGPYRKNKNPQNKDQNQSSLERRVETLKK